MDANENVVFPEDLSALSADELTALGTRALSAFEALAANDDIDDAGVAQLTELADGIEAVRAESDGRVAAAAQRQTSLSDARAKLAQFKTQTQVAAQAEADEVEPEDAGDGDEGGAPPEAAPPAPTAAASGRTRTTARKTAPSLAAAQAAAPAVPVAKSADSRLTITAAAPSSNMPLGTPFGDLEQLVASVQSHARAMATTKGNPAFLTVASIANDFEYVADGERTSPQTLERMFADMRSGDKIEDLVAGGGWCAPSEIRYNFFNIACEDGMVDLPTFGVNRGGVQIPVSPSLADVFTGTFTNATNPWIWTEADDILTVTGTPNKPCVRVPCPSFTDTRLECYGICLTAGNLTDAAYPEATRNFLKLLMSAHAHAMNQRYISQMVTLSTSAIVMPTGCGSILSDLPDTVGIAAQDYRTRFGLCDDDVLEVVVPRWVKDAMRSDHLRRTGFWESPLTDADIDKLFRAYRVRVQYVADWQVRSTGQFGQAAASAATGWPATVDFLIYAAGTFIRGNGMSLDLGIVRDSVLNAENDHTAAWSEECHLIARQGYESRRYTVAVCTAGRTGANDCTNCHLDT